MAAHRRLPSGVNLKQFGLAELATSLITTVHLFCSCAADENRSSRVHNASTRVGARRSRHRECQTNPRERALIHSKRTAYGKSELRSKIVRSLLLAASVGKLIWLTRPPRSFPRRFSGRSPAPRPHLRHLRSATGAVQRPHCWPMSWTNFTAAHILLTT